MMYLSFGKYAGFWGVFFFFFSQNIVDLLQTLVRLDMYVMFRPGVTSGCAGSEAKKTKNDYLFNRIKTQNFIEEKQLVSQLVGALSPVNHKGLHQG